MKKASFIFPVVLHHQRKMLVRLKPGPRPFRRDSAELLTHLIRDCDRCRSLPNCSAGVKSYSRDFSTATVRQL